MIDREENVMRLRLLRSSRVTNSLAAEGNSLEMKVGTWGGDRTQHGRLKKDKTSQKRAERGLIQRE